MKTLEEPILVTGGAGFIGSYIVDRLLLKGHETHVLDNLSSGNPKYIENWKKFKNFKFFKFDLLDKKKLKTLPDYSLIYHAAADPEVRMSVINPENHFKQNTLATFNLLETIKDTSIKKFVFFFNFNSIW